MNAEAGKERIIGMQFMCAICVFIQSTVLRSIFVVAVTGRDSWLMAWTGFLVFAPMAAVYALLCKWFPEKNLFQINEAVFGKIAGKILSCVYLFFFLSLGALNLRDVGAFVVDFIMLETPEFAVLLLFLATCVFALRRGLEGFMRLLVWFPIIGFAIVLINFFFVLSDVNWGFLLPMFQREPMEYVQGTHVVATIPFGELVVMLLFVSSLRKGEPVGKMFFWGAFLSALFMFIILLRDIVTLGPLMEKLALPSFEAVRTVSIRGIVARMESLYAFLMVTLLFFKVCILLYGCTVGITQITGLPSYRPLLCPMGALLLCYSFFAYKSTIENAYWGSFIAPICWTLFEYIMPLATLLVAWVRKRGHRQETEVSPA